jgi:hypothetical protein
MEFIGWMYDIAREQSPLEDSVGELLRRSGAAGYNTLGLYFEHRYAYPSAPWAAAPGAVTPEMVKRLIARAKQHGVRLIPFLNTLAHMEGFIRAAGGQWLAEDPTRNGSLQLCPSRKECVEFAQNLVTDVLATFDDEWVHIGGDEASQLGVCLQCKERIEEYGEGRLLADFYGNLCRMLVQRGRRPCLWGDMLLQHPAALDALPHKTVIFDWQYFSRPAKSTQLFREHGFDVVCCPSVQTYNSAWCFLDDTQRNIDEHAADAKAAGALGVLLTTWEASFFSQYATFWPVVFAAGRRLARGEDWRSALIAESSLPYAEVAAILGQRIPATSAFLAPGTWRKLRDGLVVRQNPFVLWREWRDEACGPIGDTLLGFCDQAAKLIDGHEPMHFAIELHRVAIEWVRLVESAYRAYEAGNTDRCVELLRTGQPLLERLRPGLVRAVSEGGSRADLSRLDVLQNKVRTVLQRLEALPRSSAYRPAFEVLTHDRYVSGDQGAWGTGAAGRVD